MITLQKWTRQRRLPHWGEKSFFLVQSTNTHSQGIYWAREGGNRLKARRGWGIHRLRSLMKMMSCSYTIMPKVKRSIYFCQTFGVLYCPTILGLIERSTPCGRMFDVPSDTKFAAWIVTYVMSLNVSDVSFERSVYYCIKHSTSLERSARTENQNSPS
jgi:hypothetical protein